jgi:hypothetical protein
LPSLNPILKGEDFRSENFLCLNSSLPCEKARDEDKNGQSDLNFKRDDSENAE